MPAELASCIAFLLFDSSIVLIRLRFVCHTIPPLPRLAKEAAYYKKEAAENETVLAAMKAPDGPGGNVKQQEGVLAESLQMIPHSEAMLKKNLDELLGMGQEADGDGEWTVAAKKLLAENGMGEDQGEDETTAVDDVKEGEAF